MKPRDFKTHATYFNILSPISELSDYRIYSLHIQGFRFGKFVQVRGSHGNAYYAGKYTIIGSSNAYKVQLEEGLHD